MIMNPTWFEFHSLKKKKIRSIKIFINPFIFQTLVVILCSCRLGDTFASALWDARVFIYFLFFKLNLKAVTYMHQKVGSYQVTHILDVFLNVVITFFSDILNLKTIHYFLTPFTSPHFNIDCMF